MAMMKVDALMVMMMILITQIVKGRKENLVIKGDIIDIFLKFLIIFYLRAKIMKVLQMTFKIAGRAQRNPYVPRYNIFGKNKEDATKEGAKD